jgi:hypothetical protein
VSFVLILSVYVALMTVVNIDGDSPVN